MRKWELQRISAAQKLSDYDVGVVYIRVSLLKMQKRSINFKSTTQCFSAGIRKVIGRQTRERMLGYSCLVLWQYYLKRVSVLFALRASAIALAPEYLISHVSRLRHMHMRVLF